MQPSKPGCVLDFRIRQWWLLFPLYFVPNSVYDSLFLCNCCWALLHCFIELPATNPWMATTHLESILRYVELGLFFAYVCDFAIISTEFHLPFYHPITYHHDISERWQWRAELLLLLLLYNKHTPIVYNSFWSCHSFNTNTNFSSFQSQFNHGKSSVSLRRESKDSWSGLWKAAEETSFLSINPCPAITVLSHGHAGTPNPKVLFLEVPGFRSL